ncbi:MAG: hypothetical protein GX260_02290 [Tissierellia bacterium]|jgi:Na+-transporting methylmalonyl-CoA/oxaloacetate decarboxylase gamma subunit|nr:hypothetical protein [Bacillota bacterium]NLL22597.1 hypothetical protein [Tissierellia bacterium]
MIQGLELLVIGMISVFIVMLLIYLLVYILSRSKSVPVEPLPVLPAESSDDESAVLAAIVAAVKYEMGALDEDKQWQISIERNKGE